MGAARAWPKRFKEPCERRLERSRLSLANVPMVRVVSRPTMSAISVAFRRKADMGWLSVAIFGLLGLTIRRYARHFENIRPVADPRDGFVGRNDHSPPAHGSGFGNPALLFRTIRPLQNDNQIRANWTQCMIAFAEKLRRRPVRIAQLFNCYHCRQATVP